jgi:hypothetical protein
MKRACAESGNAENLIEIRLMKVTHTGRSILNWNLHGSKDHAGADHIHDIDQLAHLGCLRDGQELAASRGKTVWAF